jgi:hypothetical protein
MAIFVDEKEHFGMVLSRRDRQIHVAGFFGLSWSEEKEAHVFADP